MKMQFLYCTRLLNRLAFSLTLSFQVFDILHEQSNVSRNISATMRSDTQNNAIHSYCMFHVIYKFNQMGDKNTRSQMRPSFDGQGVPPAGIREMIERGGGRMGGGGFGGGGRP